MDSGEIAAVVAVVGMALNYLGITSIDSSTVTGVVNGVLAIIAFGAAIWSWYLHRQNNAQQ